MGWLPEGIRDNNELRDQYTVVKRFWISKVKWYISADIFDAEMQDDEADNSKENHNDSIKTDDSKVTYGDVYIKIDNT